MIRLRVEGLTPTVDLSEGAVHHAIHVRRLEAGAAVLLFDGAGREASARLDTDGTRWVATLTEAPRMGLVGAELTLCYALAKGDKLDRVVRQVTELGVGRVLLMSTAHSVVRLDGPRAAKRLARLERVAAQAARQSGRADVPLIDGPRPLAQVATEVSAAARWVLHPKGGTPLAELAPARPAALAGGPEGGFAEDELAAFGAAGWARVTLLGPVLRTETAAVVGCALALHHLGTL